MSYSMLNSLTELIGTTCIYRTEIYAENEKPKPIEIKCRVHDFEYIVEDSLFYELSVIVKLIPLDEKSIDEDTLHECYNGVGISFVSFTG